MLIGYARVSTDDQTLDLQVDALHSAGCKQIFRDTASGAKAERPGLTRALDHVRDGDIVVAWRFDRLGRSLGSVIELMTQLDNRGIGFKSLTEQIDTTTGGGRLIFHIFGALAEFERNLIRERTNAGLVAARARGRTGGRPKRLDTDRKVQMARRLHADRSNSIEDICQTLGVSRATRVIRDVHARPITPRPGSTCSRYLYVVNGGYEVTVNAHESEERQAFSEAHEIVHTFFREVRPDCIPSKEEERLCDLGASILMMPTERVRRFLNAVGLSLDGLGACGSEFGASLDASGCRAMAVTEEPACFLVGRIKRKKDEEERNAGEPRLRVHHWNSSPAWPDQGTYLNLPFKPGSLVAEAFDHEDYREGHTTLGTYFRDEIHDIEARGYSFTKPGPNDADAAVVAAVRQCVCWHMSWRSERALLRPVVNDF